MVAGIAVWVVWVIRLGVDSWRLRRSWRRNVLPVGAPVKAPAGSLLAEIERLGHRRQPTTPG